MVNQWFYTHGDDRLGPYSAEEMKSLAILGNILPTDTVWKNDMATGVQARRVHHLFASVDVGAVLENAVAVVEPATVISVLPEPLNPAPLNPLFEPIPDNIELAPEVKAPPVVARAPDRPVQKRRVRALAGAVIVSQDGAYVKFRKKCTTCGSDDSSWNTQQIVIGLMKSSFFCRKCRKNREVTLQGNQG